MSQPKPFKSYSVISDSPPDYAYINDYHVTMMNTFSRPNEAQKYFKIPITQIQSYLNRAIKEN